MEKILVGEKRKVQWKDKKCRLFQGFDENLKQKMEENELTIHMHYYTILSS